MDLLWVAPFPGRVLCWLSEEEELEAAHITVGAAGPVASRSSLTRVPSRGGQRLDLSAKANSRSLQLLLSDYFITARGK